MKQKLSYLTLSIALLASSNWCNAANRYVSAGSDGDGLSWATAKGSIKSAVESCHTGDTVFVSSGLYNEYVSIVDGINILGGYNADTGARDIETFETILDGTSLGKYLIVKYDSPCENPTLIEGLTLQNAEHSSDGGAAYIRANITLSKCRIKNCKGQNGGGVFNDGGVIKDCIPPPVPVVRYVTPVVLSKTVSCEAIKANMEPYATRTAVSSETVLSITIRQQ